MSLTQSIDIKLFINLAEAKWAAICPLRLSKAGKQFDVNAVCKPQDPKNVETTLNVFATFFGSRVIDG
jgi:hypothetical protein